MKKLIITSFIAIFSLSVLHAGSIWLPKMFGDNMVLQRGMKVPVWGTASPNSKISVEFAGNSVQTKAQESGQWMVKLPSLKAGGPFELKIIGEETIVFKNVMVGDVWIASGQSNMEYGLNDVPNGKEEVAAAKYTNIRLFKADYDFASRPKTDLRNGHWESCKPENAGSFSAVFYFFGKKVHLEKNVAVGLIEAAWSGTMIEPWISYDAIVTVPGFEQKMKRIASKMPENIDLTQNLEANSKKWDIAGNSNLGLEKGVHLSTFNDSDWPSIKMPATLDSCDIGQFEGVCWYRKSVEIPHSFVGKPLELHLGKMQDNDKTWLNGEEVGNTPWDNWASNRCYRIPANKVKEGKNVFTIRIGSVWENNGFVGPADSMYLSNGSGEKISLATIWKYNKTLEPTLPEAVYYQYYPTVIFNAMIAPLIPYCIKGALWYQGESNTDTPLPYRDLLPALINGWRNSWGQGEFPFLFVQLPNYGDNLNWALLREAQLHALKLPNTGMVVTIDIGESSNIHPKNKLDVGNRLYEAARHVAYGEKNVFSGPVYESMKTEGKTVRLTFRSTGSGMTAKGSETLEGFEVAGSDRAFYPAKAEIRGGDIVVASAKVIKPLFVRYGWAGSPKCNLFNKEGLPASPFRTDDF